MLENVLTWLTSSDGGALLVVMWAVSWGLEKSQWWHALDSRTRALVILLASIVIALAAAVLQQHPELVAALDVYFQPVYFVVLAWLATQTAHLGYKRLTAGEA